MGKWQPIFWPFAVGLASFPLLLVLEFFEGQRKEEAP
jgi:hypothetical protein